jgi:hypothetical protein
MKCSGKYAVVWSTPDGPDFMHDQDDEGTTFVSTFDTYEEAEDTAERAFASNIWPFVVVELP